jgi:GntR family transcriptional repressor for pyruvate dehydrogenase complex
MPSKSSAGKGSTLARDQAQSETGAWLERLVDLSVYKPIKEGSAVSETVARLGQAIAVGLLRPGDQLPPEARLAENLGISAVTLRSALTILRQGGLLETRRGRGGGTFVSARGRDKVRVLKRAALPSNEELRDLVDYRCVLEGGGAASAAARRTPEHLEELRKQIELMDESRRFSSWNEADTMFHLVLADASGCARLVSAIAELRGESQSISMAYEPVPEETMKHSNQQHREVLRAVETRKPDRARELMVRHIESTYDLWLGLGPAISGSAAPRTVPAASRRRSGAKPRRSSRS